MEFGVGMRCAPKGKVIWEGREIVRFAKKLRGRPPQKNKNKNRSQLSSEIQAVEISFLPLPQTWQLTFHLRGSFLLA